jgi:hypothetical protein
LSLAHLIVGIGVYAAGAWIVGAAIGTFFGLLFGGVKGQWVDAIYGPETDETE